MAAAPIYNVRMHTQLASLLKDRFGVSLSPLQVEHLWLELNHRAVNFTPKNSAEWLHEILDGQWSTATKAELTHLLTVSETYFMRDKRSLAWLASTGFPLLIQRAKAQAKSVIHIWSAACCTGEEAYSLKIIYQSIATALENDCRVEIWATDISPNSVEKAKQGVYYSNSFRDYDDTFLNTHFSPGPEPHSWLINPELRNGVNFSVLNLLDIHPESLVHFDLILCRYVLMYFSHDKARDVLQKLFSCLSDHGLLLVSAVEASIATQCGLQGFWVGDNYAIPRINANFAELMTTKDTNPRISLVAKSPANTPNCTEILSSPNDLGVTNRVEQFLANNSSCSVKPNCKVSAPSPLNSDGSQCIKAALAYWQNDNSWEALAYLDRAIYLNADDALAHYLRGICYQKLERRALARRAISVALTCLDNSSKTEHSSLIEGFDPLHVQALCKQWLEANK